MKLFTFTNIIGILLVVIAASNLSFIIKKRKTLGEMTLKARSEFKYVDKSQLVLLLLVVMLMVSSVISTPFSTENWLFYTTVIVSCVCFAVSSVLTALVKPGFYKSGIATGSNILDYSEIKGYKAEPLKKNNDVTGIYINSNGGFLSKNIFFCVDTVEFPEAKAILKKKINKKA